jgi:2-oxoisovalerate dehydrogenase E1 component beta subunit
MVHYAVEAANRLEAEGWSVEVMDVRTVYPLPKDEIVASARKTGKVLVVYEDNFSISIGSEIAALIADGAWQWLDAPVKRLGGLDVPSMPYAKPMENFFMPDPEKIYRELKALAEF